MPSTNQGRGFPEDLDPEIARVREGCDPAEHHPDAGSPDKAECAI